MALEPFLTLCAALVFAVIHLLTPRLTFLSALPRSRWLSFAGGVAVAYVFLHILPELAAVARTHVADGTGALWVWALALAGLSVFYGLERAIAARPHPDHAPAFWLHVGTVAVYNVIIGSLLLHREEAGLESLALYTVAMSLHFLSADFGMWQDHRKDYERVARWVLAAAVLAGWALGRWAEVPPFVIDCAFALLAGSVILNVMKEELPDDRQSRFGPFLVGAAGYGALLMWVGL